MGRYLAHDPGTLQTFRSPRAGVRSLACVGKNR
jgi:hypothetical protein